MRFTLKNPRFLQYIDYQNVRKTEFLGCQSQEKYGIPLLGQIPIVQSIREGGDSGEPVALSSRPDGQAFIDLASTLAKSADGE